ncbi:MAG: ABC transporter substrate-binding protein [Oceanospirillaceae bacterium]|nr:ABC transporter substrate-binding protein [Oceanospirillaceae bacterium]
MSFLSTKRVSKTKSILLAAALGVTSSQVLAECGNVTIAEMNWASAEFAANLDKIILSEGYGCNVELIPGATTTTFASMEAKGQPDIAPEFWANAVAVRLKAAEEKGDLTVGVQLISDASEGWFISESIAKSHPELKTVADVLARPELFPNKEEPGKGAFMTCPAGWACEIINKNLAKESAFNLEKAGFVTVDPGSSAGLDASIAKASQRKEAWFGYYWQPTANVSKYNLKLLDMDSEFDEKNWHDCVVDDTCESPKRTSWVYSKVNTVVVTEFAQKNPEVMGYLNQRSYNSADVGPVLIYMSENQANGEDAAYFFLKNNEALWTQWVPADVAEKVKKSL